LASPVARISQDAFVARGHTYRNVVAEYGPQSGDLVVVGAHYDAFAATGDLPGADDNASGVAGLLDLGRLLAAHPPKNRVRLVAFANEEPPFFGSQEMGSAIDAAHLERSNEPVAAMICLEMIGYFHGEQTWPSPLLAMLYPGNATFIAVTGGWHDHHLARGLKAAINGAGSIQAVSFTGPREMSDASDQRNYWSHGWPSVMVSDTAYLRNPNYHTVRDSAETLDYEKMANVVDGIFSFLAE
jgi:Zn-dependent M28 family amino/carboxypeptidase